MKKIFAVAVLGAIALVGGKAQAQTPNIASHDVTFEVQAINSITLGSGVSLTINAAVAGDAPTSVSANSSYAITTNEVGQKVTAEIDADMPTGVTLSVLLAAPTGGAATSQSLSTGAQDVVTGVSTLNESGLQVHYTLAAISAAGVVASDSRTVTYTIIAGS